jgi:NAD(P)-dependent dehydrogenase (short-subunit alcohol dehydrogenase family)
MQGRKLTGNPAAISADSEQSGKRLHARHSEALESVEVLWINASRILPSWISVLLWQASLRRAKYPRTRVPGYRSLGGTCGDSAKAALESLVRYFAVALAKRGITVNAIRPGWTEDSVLNSLPQQAQDLIRNWHAHGWTQMGRLGTPEDVGNVATLFCSGASWLDYRTADLRRRRRLIDESMNPDVPPEIQLG